MGVKQLARHFSTDLMTGHCFEGYAAYMTTQLNPETGYDEVISENVNTLVHRAKVTLPALAAEVGMSHQTLWRKVSGTGSWSYSEVRSLAEALGVTTDELAGALPAGDVWRARRDSNSQPSDWESRPLLRLVWSVKRDFTSKLRSGPPVARHLAVVA